MGCLAATSRRVAVLRPRGTLGVGRDRDGKTYSLGLVPGTLTVRLRSSGGSKRGGAGGQRTICFRLRERTPHGHPSVRYHKAQSAREIGEPWLADRST